MQDAAEMSCGEWPASVADATVSFGAPVWVDVTWQSESAGLVRTFEDSGC